MINSNEMWQTEVNGEIYETTFEGLTQWISEGSLLPQDKVKKGNLHWVEAQKVPALHRFFNAKELGITPPPIISTSTNQTELQTTQTQSFSVNSQPQFAAQLQNFNEPPPPQLAQESAELQNHNHQLRQVDLIDPAITKGANWFYWIAALSVINSVIMLTGVNWSFMMGLGITQLLDGIADVIAQKTGATGITPLHLVVFVIDFVCAGFFVGLGYFAGRAKKWAFIVGLVIYSLDGLIYLLAGSVFGVVIHALAIFSLSRGMSAINGKR